MNVNSFSQAQVAMTDSHVNRAGDVSFYRSLKEQTLNVLMCGTLGSTYYASAKELEAEATAVLVACRQQAPEFLAKALVYAREKGYMKAAPVLGLTILSGGQGATKPLFLQVFPRVVRTPDDLRAFVELCLAGALPGRKGLGGMARQAVRKWLGTLSEYHALKYGSAASKSVTLRDIIRLAHPKPDDEALSERFAWLCGRKPRPEQSLNSAAL